MIEDLLWEYQKAVQEIYRTESLTCLAGPNDDFTHNGKQVVIWYSDVVRKTWIKNNGAFNYMKVFDDIVFCSRSLLYTTASAYLYRPYVNDPIADAFHTGNEMLYPNYQGLLAVRYSMYLDSAGEKAYNYWDRIGDVIESFFPGILKPHQIYFGKVLENCVPSQFHSNPGYIWLNEFKSAGYAELNKKRKRGVHIATSDTDFKYQAGEKVADKEGMEVIQKDRIDDADFYKEQIRLTLLGFENMLILLEEVSEKLF